MKLYQKLLLGLLFAFVVSLVFRRLASKYLSVIVPLDVIFLAAYLPLFIMLAMVFIWHSRERKGLTSSHKIWFRQLIAFCLALDLTMFGVQKIQQLQMLIPLGKLDEPFSSFSGYDLVWAFFHFSYGFTCVIALLQIIAAALILFNRTRLLGSLVALPMLVFISLMDIFYAMPPGVIAQGVVLLTAVLYFICADGSHLLPQLFIRKNNSDTPIKWLWPTLFALVTILCTITYENPDKHPFLSGKYRVENLKINGISYQAKTSTDSVLSHVYLDLDDVVGFRWNDHRRVRIGNYKLDSRGKVHMQWRYPKTATEHFKGTLRQQGTELHLNGEMEGKRYQMILIKE
ncbi:hypothetical protein ACFQZS_11210 [Mucilaginibacter calamicampi]|uniref:DoxX family protein n=1 Tax=Mucilaginibacter calamicampi TaxID=1302352 RepID=A0ABW2YYM1_9SPHI